VDGLNVISGAVVAAGVRIHQHSRTLSAGSDHQQDRHCRSQAARALDPVFARQLLTDLKIMNLRLGLLMNFGMATMKAGIRRIANGAGHALWPRALRAPVYERCPCPAQALL
jgi:hypothetical protein